MRYSKLNWKLPNAKCLRLCGGNEVELLGTHGNRRIGID